MNRGKNQVHRWVVVGMLGVVVASVLVWQFTRETLPRVIRIGTGAHGGLYHEMGEVLGEALEARTGRKVDIVTTQGSVENWTQLQSGEIDLALVQGGSVDSSGVEVVAPLYNEVVILVVRTGRGINRVEDLRGKRVAVGRSGSGMRRSAAVVLAQYNIDVMEFAGGSSYFAQLEEDDSLDGAVVTTGLLNPDLNRVLAQGQFKILPVNDAAAIKLRNPFFRQFEIPGGFFGETNRVPPQPLPTVATVAFLTVKRGERSSLLVDEVLATLYEGDMQLKVPLLIPRNEAIKWVPTKLHENSRSYFSPEDELGRLSAIMESLAAVKELLVAFVAGGYLLWDRWRRSKARRDEEDVSEQKERLDLLLERTVQIEEKLLGADDLEALQTSLDEVTRIKLEALREFTHEELRGDQAFSIFLTQCSNLINKIQIKIMEHRQAGS